MSQGGSPQRGMKTGLRSVNLQSAGSGQRPISIWSQKPAGECGPGARSLCTAQQIVASAARWRAREGKSMVFQASLTRGKGGDMKLLYRCCAGLDIHRDTVSACVRRRVGGQAEAAIEEQVFGTFTQDLERLRTWLKKSKVRQVAMESTGVYWIPIWNVLERGFTLTLVNPATVRALQGQKTDRIDARRIAEYLQHGLLRGSFIPPKPIRELRELTRMRVHIQQDRNRVINRIGRLLETANIKLASVASNVVGKSGRAILRRIAEGCQQPQRLAQLALGHLKQKTPDLMLALDGRTDPHFRWVLTGLLHKLEWLD